MIEGADRLRRRLWNRGLKLCWYKLWIRKNEFHKSLDIDPNALTEMTREEREEYMNDLVKRRNIAHERDLD